MLAAVGPASERPPWWFTPPVKARVKSKVVSSLWRHGLL